MEPEQDQQKQFHSEPIGFERKIDYASLYSMIVFKSNELHGEGRHDDAITHFSMMLPNFAGIFDQIFVNNCHMIEKKYNDQPSKSYMLQKAELSRLMTRAGIAPKPDVRLRYTASWNVPKEISDMSFDGKKDNREKTEALHAIVENIIGDDNNGNV